MIPQRAEQEFYEELTVLLNSQPDTWQAIPAHQKQFYVSPSDFDYYRKLTQQHLGAAAIETDTEGLPIMFFLGIRVMPAVDQC